MARRVPSRTRVSWAAFVLYVWVYGRRAAARGLTGQWGELRPSWEDETLLELSPRATVQLGGSD